MLGGGSGSSASRAAIKKALLAIQLTRKADEQSRESREERHEERQEELPRRSSSGAPGPTLPAIKAGRRVLHPSRPDAGGPAGVDASALPSNTQGGVFRGSTVGDKLRKRERLKRGFSQGGAAHSSHSLETPADDDGSDSSGSDTPQSDVKSSKSTPGSGGLSQGVQLIMDQLEMQRSQAGPPSMSPFGSGLAAMKVKHRLQALHQEAKKKPPQPESKIATSGLSVGNVVALEKAREPETQENVQQQAAMAAVNAAINAARTTLPNFSSTPDEAEEAEITAMLGEVDSELLDLVKEVQRILRWLFADGDVDFDGLLSHQELKAIFQRASQPLGSSLGMEVDISTAHAEKNARYSRSRFIELVILVCVRVNQSPILSSRLAEVKRFVGRGNSATGRTLDASSGSEQLAAPQAQQMKVSLLSGVPKMESTPAAGGSKWSFARSAVHDMSERRHSQDDLNPLKKLESLFAMVKK